MITVKIDEETLLDMLLERVEFWADDALTIDLYKQMYDSYVYGGVFDGSEIDIPQIVDNDYINNCSIIYEGDDNFDELLKIYREQGLGDCSCESEHYSYIEAVDEDEKPTAFLVRW